MPPSVQEMLDAFGVTVQNVVDMGMDPSVCEFLPQDDLVPILSELATNIQAANPPAQAEPEPQPEPEAQQNEM